MTDKEILEYYNPQYGQVEHSTWKDNLIFVALLPIILPMGAAILLLIFISIPFTYFSEKIYPAHKKRIARKFIDKGYGIIVGYDAGDKTATKLAEDIKSKYASKVYVFDWSKVATTEDWRAIAKESIEKDALLAIDETVDYEGICPSYDNPLDPCNLYAVHLGNNIERVGTYPLMNDWDHPTEVLPKEEIFKRIEKALE